MCFIREAQFWLFWLFLYSFVWVVLKIVFFLRPFFRFPFLFGFLSVLFPPSIGIFCFFSFQSFCNFNDFFLRDTGVQRYFVFLYIAYDNGTYITLGWMNQSGTSICCLSRQKKRLNVKKKKQQQQQQQHLTIQQDTKNIGSGDRGFLPKF